MTCVSGSADNCGDWCRDGFVYGGVFRLRGPTLTRGRAIAGLATASITAAAFTRPARAADKVRFLSSWFAEAEHGGYYQAKATGLFEKAGLDVDIKMGGPQVNALQLLTGGDCDITIGYDIATLSAVAHGLPVITVAASFQHDLQGIMAHADVKTLAGLKGHKLLMSTSAHATFWPWLKQHYGFTDEMAAAYTFNLQPFFTDPTVAQQANVTTEPFQAQKNHVPINYFWLAKYGYPTYGSTIITTQPFLKQNPTVVARFVHAVMEGWKSYLINPGPGNALIKTDNPNMEDDQLAYTLGQLKSLGVVTGGDAGKSGIGTMTEGRWKQTRDFLVQSGLLADNADWKSAFTLSYLPSARVMA
jgi:NitT/TauT family transport system substrate-binding protein